MVSLLRRPDVGPGIQHLPQLGVPFQGTAEPLPLLGPRGCGSHPRPLRTSATAWAPGTLAQERRHARAISAWAADPCPGPRPVACSPLRARGRPAPPARPPGGPRTVWDCRLWLASMAAVSGTVSSSRTLPAGGFSMKAIPERPSTTASGPGTGTRGADSRRPPGSAAAAAAVNTRRPTRRRRPPGPRGPSADLAPPPLLSTLATLCPAASRGFLAPNCRSHRCPGPAPPRGRTAGPVPLAPGLRSRGNSP